MAGRIDRQTLKRVQGSESNLGALFLFVVNWDLRVPGQDSATSIVLFPDFWFFVSPRVCVLPCEFQRDGKSRHPQTTHSLKHAKGHTMKSLILALTLINAPVEEQDLMLADLYDADPRLAGEVLDMADDIADSAAYGGETHFNVPREPFFDSVDDSTKKPDTSGWNYLKDDTVNVKDAYDVDHSGTLQWEGSIGGAKPNVPIA